MMPHPPNFRHELLVSGMLDNMSEDSTYEILGMSGGVIRARVLAASSAEALLASMGCSKSSASRAIAEGRLLVDDVSAAHGQFMRPGSVATLVLARPSVQADAVCDPVNVLFEDETILAAEKPAGLLVHPDGTGAPTLADRVQGHLFREGSVARAQAVQRLDVDTTGIVLFSLTDEFQPAFDRLVAERGMRKRYLAMTAGEFPAGERTISQPIGRDRHDARRMRISATGKPAITRVGRLAVGHGRSLLLVELLTGRRHQIRVHLSAMGFPILGDELYGGAPDADGLMLHAWREDFTHPVTGERIGIRTAWPERFGRWFDESCAGARVR